MTEPASYSFRMEKTSYKSRDLIYEEPGFKLVVGLELSGVKEFDFVGCDTAFTEWTVPEKEPISEEKRIQIRERLRDWSRAQYIRLDIGPPIDMNEYYGELEAKGYTVGRRPDGSHWVVPPRRPGLLKRLWGVLKRSLPDA